MGVYERFGLDESWVGISRVFTCCHPTHHASYPALALTSGDYTMLVFPARSSAVHSIARHLGIVGPAHIAHRSTCDLENHGRTGKVPGVNPVSCHDVPTAKGMWRGRGFWGDDDPLGGYHIAPSSCPARGARSNSDSLAPERYFTLVTTGPDSPNPPGCAEATDDAMMMMRCSRFRGQS